MNKDPNQEHEKDLELLEQLGRVMLPMGFRVIDMGPEKLPGLSPDFGGAAGGPLYIIDIADPIIKELARWAIKEGIGGELIRPRSINFHVESDGSEKIEFEPKDHGTVYPAFMDMYIWYNTFKKVDKTGNKDETLNIFEKLGYSRADIITGLWQYLSMESNDFYFKCVKEWHWPGSVEIVPADQETFALPSLPVMFTLLALFAGKPDRIPRPNFITYGKDQERLTDSDKQEADAILNSLMGKTVQDCDDTGTPFKTQYYIVNENVKIEATGSFDLGLFKDDLAEQERSLSLYLKRTFGPEGLRHFLALIIGLDENFKRGYFEWDINEHLKRLGLQKKKSRAYDKEARITATKIITIFTTLFLSAQSKEGDREVFTGLKLFNIDGFKAETLKNEVISGTLLIRAADFWYKKAFAPEKDGMKYTKLLKKIAQVNHREHPLVLKLAPWLALFWRMDPENKRKLSVISLMDWCDLDYTGHKKTDNLKALESQLDFMIKHGYLGAWENTGENKYPSQCKDPFSCNLTFFAPEWFNSEMKNLRDRRKALLLPAGPQAKTITPETIEALKKEFGISNKKLANHLGVTPQLIGAILGGKRRITDALTAKFLNSEKFGEYLKSRPANNQGPGG